MPTSIVSAQSGSANQPKLKRGYMGPTRSVGGIGQIAFIIEATPGVEYRPIPSFPSYVAGSDGSIWSGRSACRLSPSLSGRDYWYVGVLRPGGEGMASRTVHGLVCEAFHGPRPKDQTCRHLGGNKNNNAPTNLRWGTAIEQVEDNQRNGVSNAGCRNGMAKLTEADVREINEAVWDGAYRKRLAAKYGVTLATINRVVSAATWQHVYRKAKRGRDPKKGEENSNAKLTEAGVLEIIERAACGEMRTKIARDFGVTSALIGHIIHGRAWKHVPRSQPDAVLTTQGLSSSGSP